MAPAPAKHGTRKRSAGRPRVAVVTSRYNASITDALREGAVGAYVRAGGRRSDLEHVFAPGAFELPVLSMAAAESGLFSGVLALGCLIRGETSHDRYIAEAVAHGLVGVSLATGIPVAFGVLTVDTPEQARDRAGGRRGNKGAEAMSALLETMDAIAALGEGAPPAPPKAPRPDKARRSR